MTLSTRDFKPFFAAVHRVPEPFPWQQELLEQVVGDGRWPSLLDLPTGTGKTATIDVAVFAQALEAVRPAPERQCPRRTILVVDRRTVVDQAYERALHLRTALLDPGAPPIVREVASALTQLSGNVHREARSGAGKTNSPLGVHVLRGGMPRDDSWTRDPSQPLVAVSTVDQVGSRLLFRGYGVSSGMRPIHAGLLGNDVLFLLDEVHLARPFLQTLEGLRRHYRGLSDRQLPDRWQVVQMSATPGSRPADTFGLDETRDRGHPVLRQRLQAHKPTQLVLVEQPGRDALPKQLAKAAAEHAAKPLAIGIVVNRVETARRTQELLRKELAKTDAIVHLVTGRMRPLDRDDIKEELARDVGANRDREAGSRARVVVATQCIEAGADFDFDVLLTECASLDALQQRFGRLNRLGTSEVSQGLVFARKAEVEAEDAGDPIYGQALAKTWRYLESLGQVDFGIVHFVAPAAHDVESLIAQTTDAPLLLPAHLDAWVQTSPRPHADPDPALWLHGPRPTDQDVSVVWRADIEVSDLRARDGEQDAPEDVQRRLEACPPRSVEALSVPLGAVRRWLSGQRATATSDAGALPADEDQEPAGEARPALLWDGGRAKVLDLQAPARRNRRDGPHPRGPALHPGCTLVVPASYGGIRQRNWAPEADDVVLDLGDRAQWIQKGRAVLRLQAAVLGPHLPPETKVTLPVAADPDDADADEAQAVVDVLEDLNVSGWLGEIVAALASEYKEARRNGAYRPSRSPRTIATGPLHADREFAVSGVHIPHASGPQLTVLGRKRYQPLADSLDLGAEVEQSSLTGVEAHLADHLLGVGDVARAFGEALGLPDELTRVLEEAGRWHDAGKADPRFQQWLHGGSAFRWLKAEHLLAKSALPAQDAAAREKARARAGYPSGGRHELLSVALMQSMDASARPSTTDWDLVVYLVASHHGHCRPFAPYAADADPVDVEVELHGQVLRSSSAHRLERIDSGISERFWRLVRRYGWYGLSWLETILRLADHRRSEVETERLIASTETGAHDAA